MGRLQASLVNMAVRFRSG